jgi:hypothetical protein
MSAAKRSRPEQLALAIPSEREDARIICRGVFSANYLRKHFAQYEDYPKRDEVRPIYEKLKALWQDEYIGLCKRKEAYTRTQFLEPLLAELGWQFIPEQDLPSKTQTRKRPDYCLFLDADARRRAAAQTETVDVFRESATVLEAKKVRHSLDEVSDTETPGWFPSQQVQDYLHKAKDATGQRFFNWAILTNGNEWLAEQIVYHTTTRIMTEQIVATGQSRRSRDDILKDGRIPVPPGFSQEQAEVSYWRRRVVEACIYGVDVNPLAVELAKLSLWLTCIAAEEPLNFLDHHLRVGNSLLWANPDEMHHLHTATEEERKQAAFNVGPRLADTLRAVIDENVHIEETASTEMELVKAKETRWKNVRQQLDPFLHVANVWVAALDGLLITDLDYRTLALFAVAPDDFTYQDKLKAKRLRDSLNDDIAAKQAVLTPFHWQLEFPDVFFETDGRPRPEAERGFDAVLGNPPYVSTHTSAEQAWRNTLEKRAGYI